MVTLGLWDEFVARPFVRAATTFHELGHNLNLWHGGQPAIWGNKAQNTATYIEPNCKPNYFSSMSYLFQKHGLFDANDQIQLDYSGTAQSDLDETKTFVDTSVVTPYRPTWFAPFPSALAASLNATQLRHDSATVCSSDRRRLRRWLACSAPCRRRRSTGTATC